MPHRPAFSVTLILCLVFSFLGQSAFAATFNPAPATPDGAVGSLRDAIIAVNANGESDVINLAAGTYSLTIANSAGQENVAVEGDLDLTESGFMVTIQGAGNDMTFIEQTVMDRVFHIIGNVTVELIDVTVRNGTAVDNGGAGAMPGGGDGNGGGILNDGGALTLSASHVSDNEALGADSNEGGGGIYHVNGSLALRDVSNVGSQVIDNLASGAAGSGGGIYFAQGIYSQVRARIAGNAANGSGGGMQAVNGVLNFNANSRIINNDVNGTAGLSNPGDGGGLHISGTAMVTFDNSIVSNNDAARNGGGFWVASDGTLNLISTQVNNNSAAGSGGGLFNNSGTVMLNSGAGPTNFGGNNALGTNGPGEGGGVASFGGTLSSTGSGIQRNRFQGNSAAGNGGGLLHDGTVTIEQTDFISNHSDAFGGGIAHSSGTLTLIDSTVTTNTSDISGGGVFALGITMLQSGSLVDGNMSGSAGGGLAVEGGAPSLTVDASTISNNIAGFVGGGISTNGGTIVIQNGSAISGNSSNAPGGGISIQAGAMLTVTDSSVTGNMAGDHGGGIEIRDSAPGSTANITNSAVSNNTSMLDGGGIHMGDMSSLTVGVGSMILGNTATRNGGGVYIHPQSVLVDISNTTISNNIANGNAVDFGGGGIYNDGFFLDLTTGVLIDGNQANGTSGSGGGIFNNTGGTLSLSNITISNNSASRAGGGIEDNSGAGLGVALSGVSLIGNSTGSNPGNGGGLHVTGAGDVTIDGGSVDSNVAALEGGGLWNGTGTMTLDGASITQNTSMGAAADDGGGGIFNNGGVLDLVNGSLVANNMASGASGNGGGIHVNGGTYIDEGSSVTGNTGQGIFAGAGASVNMRDTVATGNTGIGFDANGAGAVAIIRGHYEGLQTRATTSVTTQGVGEVELDGLVDIETTDSITITGDGWDGTADVILSPGEMATIIPNLDHTGTTTFASGDSQFDGVLLVDTAAVTVSAGATLGGDGEILRPTTVNGTLEPGAFDVLPRANSKELAAIGGQPIRAPGHLTIPLLDMNTSAQLNLELNGALVGSEYDQLSVVDLNLDADAMGGANLNLSLGFVPGPGQTFTIVDVLGASPVSGTFNGLAEGELVAADGSYFSISYQGGDGNDVVLTETVPSVFYVDADNVARGGAEGTSWETAFTHLQDALAVALAGAEVWVAEGVYFPDEGAGQVNDDPVSTFSLIDGVNLYGGFSGTETARSQRDPEANVTILSGDVDGDDLNVDVNFIAESVADIQGSNAHHVLSRDASTVIGLEIDGFVVTAGDATAAPETRGGGLYCNGNPDVDLVQMTFIGNQAERGGGFSRCQSTVSDSSFINNEVSDVGGAFHGQDGDFDRVLFQGNVSGNAGGAIYHGNNPLIARHTSFIGNSSAVGVGGAIRAVGNVTLDDVLFRGNNVINGAAGGLFVGGSGDIMLTNVTFTGNSATQVGGGLRIESSGSHDIANAIFWNNQDTTGVGTLSSALGLIDGTLVVSNSLVQASGGSGNWDPMAGTDGGGNLDEDPMFILPTDPTTAPTTTGDAHLIDGTVTENAGDNSFVTSGTDLDGEPRIQNGVVDMGAYEGPVRLFEDSFEALDMM